MIDGSYKLSRIYAKGWIAARSMPANDDVESIRNRATALNPFTKDPEKSRWNAGFIAAQES